MHLCMCMCYALYKIIGNFYMKKRKYVELWLDSQDDKIRKLECKTDSCISQKKNLNFKVSKCCDYFQTKNSTIIENHLYDTSYTSFWKQFFFQKKAIGFSCAYKVSKMWRENTIAFHLFIQKLHDFHLHTFEYEIYFFVCGCTRVNMERIENKIIKRWITDMETIRLNNIRQQRQCPHSIQQSNNSSSLSRRRVSPKSNQKLCACVWVFVWLDAILKEWAC